VVLSNRNEDLTRRDADIAVRMSRPTQNTLVAKKVGSVGFGFYAAPSYLKRRAAPTSWEELEGHPIIGYDTRPPTMPDGVDFDRPVSREIFALRTDNDVAQIAALRAGFGIGVTQHGIARRSGLVAIMPGALSFRLEIWVCMHENLKTSRRMRLMFDHLAAGLAEVVGDGN